MKIADFCKTAAGGTPLKSKKEFYEGGNIPWLLSGEVNNRDIFQTKKFITQAGLDGSSAKIFPENTVLIAMYGATAGEVGMLRCKAATNQAVCGIYPNEKVLPEYLYYFFLSHKDLLVAQAVGNAQPNISQLKIKNTEIPLPSIPEQKRIVAILDQAFADIDKARANAEQNLKNSRELYLSKKCEIFGNVQAESEAISLPSVCESIFAGGDAPKKGMFSKTKTEQFQIPIYANAVKNNGLYGFTDYARADKPSITIAARGSGTGHIELRREPFLPIVRLIVLIPDGNKVSLEYLKHALQNLDILRSGSAIPQLTVPMIKEYSIPVPSLDKQRSVIEELDYLNRLVEQVQKSYKKKILLLEELKKSVLQKVFSGELTKNDKQGAAA